MKSHDLHHRNMAISPKMIKKSQREASINFEGANLLHMKKRKKKKKKEMVVQLLEFSIKLNLVKVISVQPSNFYMFGTM